MFNDKIIDVMNLLQINKPRLNFHFEKKSKQKLLASFSAKLKNSSKDLTSMFKKFSASAEKSKSMSKHPHKLVSNELERNL